MPHLEEQAIPRAAIPDTTNHFSLVNALWESEFDLACSIEEFQLFGGEFQIQTGEIVLELRYLPRSHDRDYWHRLMAHQASATCAMLRLVCSETDFTAEMIGAARCSSGRNSFIPSLDIRAPSALPSP